MEFCIVSTHAVKIWDYLNKNGQVVRLWNDINFSETSCTSQMISIFFKYFILDNSN